MFFGHVSVTRLRPLGLACRQKLGCVDAVACSSAIRHLKLATASRSSEGGSVGATSHPNRRRVASPCGSPHSMRGEPYVTAPRSTISASMGLFWTVFGDEGTLSPAETEARERSHSPPGE